MGLLAAIVKRSMKDHAVRMHVAPTTNPAEFSVCGVFFFVFFLKHYFVACVMHF